MELYSAYDNAEVQVNGRPVPLETDSTTPLAYRLNDTALWNVGVMRFITGDAVNKRMLLIQPYEAGRIPVVFVHGTASSPVWWAEMFNTLRADPVIRKRFQFWFIQYNSSNMIMLSATPHRGSYLTKDWVRYFVRKMITLPINLVVNSPEHLRQAITQLKLPASIRDAIPTSIDGMSAENPILQSLVSPSRCAGCDSTLHYRR